MNLRLIKPSDIEALAGIVEANYTITDALLAKRELRAMFDQKVLPPRYVLAEEKARPLGFAGYSQTWMDYHIYNIFWVNVHPEHQGKGVGTALVRRVIKEIKRQEHGGESLVILLTATNPHLYENKFGFRKITMFKEGKTALMALSLENSNES